MIKIEGLKKDYKSFSLDCTLKVQKGRITGLIGQNGAGKSTTFKALLGLISFDGGNIQIFGKDIRDFDKKDKEKLGVVLSDSGFSGYLTINDIIPILSSMYHGFNKEKFIESIENFGLPRDKKIKEFSTGMKAKLKLLVALSHGAELLILDEPTAGLDVVARDELLMLLREYMEENEERAILISSHISSDLETLCDDIYMIHDGRVILHEDTDVLLGDFTILKVSDSDFETLDKRFVSYRKKESFGYSLLTRERRYYIENYPRVIIENGSIDSIITMMIKGERL